MTEPTGYFNQTFAVEYTASGGLDGVTPGPNLEGGPPSTVGNSDPQQLFRVATGALGLINPDYAHIDATAPVLGTSGNRLVTYLWIEGAVAGAADASADIVDAVSGTPRVQKNIGTFVGATEFFHEGIFVPQGSMIRVRGMSGIVKVRLHIQLLNTAQDLARVLSASCCIDSP